MADAAQDRVSRLLDHITEAENPDTTFDPYRLLAAVRKVTEQYRSAQEAEQTYADMEWPPSMAERGSMELATAQARSFALLQAVETLAKAFETEER
jgi:hypothetical protein